MSVRERTGAHQSIFLVHVDDSIILAESGEDEKAGQDLKKHCDVKVMERVVFFLGQEMAMVPGAGILLHQAQHVWEQLHKARMWKCRPKSTHKEEKHRLQKASGTIVLEGDDRRIQYKQWVGGLLYLTTHTRPHLAYSVGVLSSFMANPTDEHFQKLKRVPGYLRGTSEVGLMFQFQPPAEEQGVRTFSGTDFEELGLEREKTLKLYSNADLAVEFYRRRSTSGMLMLMNGCPIMWGANLQTVVATSTTEAQYISAATAVNEALWVRKVTGDVDGRVQRMPLYCDNQSVTRRKQHQPGITPNDNTTHVPTAGISAARTKPNHTPTRHPRAKGKIIP